MAQRVRVLAVSPDDLNSIPKTYILEREPSPQSCPLISTYMLWLVHIIYTQKKHISSFKTIFLPCLVRKIGILVYFPP